MSTNDEGARLVPVVWVAAVRGLLSSSSNTNASTAAADMQRPLAENSGRRSAV